MNFFPAFSRSRGPLPMRKLVLNGNKIDWSSIGLLTSLLPQLEELHLSTNDLTSPLGDDDPTDTFKHGNLRQLFLSCNPVGSFGALSRNLYCPNLESLSLSECPIEEVPEDISESMKHLVSLNLTMTK